MGEFTSGHFTVLAVHLQFLCLKGGKESGGKSQKWINEIICLWYWV